MSLDRVQGVLLDLNDAEREVMTNLLRVAENHLDEAAILKWGSRGGYMSRKLSENVYSSFIADLRTLLGLDGPGDLPAVRQLRHAGRRDDSHVSPTRIVCAFDRCNEVLRGEEKDNKILWQQAIEQGWKQWSKEGTDLYCPLEHDRMGNPRYPE